MNARRALRPLLAVLLFFPLLAFAAKSAHDQRADTRKMRDEVLKEIYQQNPIVKDKVAKAVGYAVFSNVGVNVVFASFAGGHGIVVGSGGHETFMKMGSAGIGLGLGVKDFRALFIFNDKEKLEAFIDKGWDFSGQADAAAKSDDKGAAIAGAHTVMPGVEVYQLTKNGLALQATLQGTKFWRNKDLN